MTPLATIRARIDGAIERGSAAVVLNNAVDLRRAVEAMHDEGWAVVRDVPGATTVQSGRGHARRWIELLNLEHYS